MPTINIIPEGSDYGETCSTTATNIANTTTSPTAGSIHWDYYLAVSCLFCCCCSSGGGGGGGSCCSVVNPTDDYCDIYSLGGNSSYGQAICSEDGSPVELDLWVSNQMDSTIMIDSISGVVYYADYPCTLSGSETAPDLPSVGISLATFEATHFTGASMNFSNLTPCCTYTVFFVVNVSGVGGMARPALLEAPALKSAEVEEGGPSGLAKPCPCMCRELPAVPNPILVPTLTLNGSACGGVNTKFMKLPGEPNCKYIWNLQADWNGQGIGRIVARDRCSFIHIDEKRRLPDENGHSPANVTDAYQIAVCGSTLIAVQMENDAGPGGQVRLEARFGKCFSGHNPDCCCEEKASNEPGKLAVVSSRQSTELPGYVADENNGVLEIRKLATENPILGLAYELIGREDCVYKVRIDLDVEVTPDCLFAFFGGDYLSFAPNEDGKGSIHVDLWVCGNAVFTTTICNGTGRVAFKVTDLGESMSRTPLCL